MSKKFSVGDKVIKINADTTDKHQNGDEGTVIRGGSEYVDVDWDNNKDGIVVETCKLELITEKSSTTFYVGARVKKINGNEYQEHQDDHEGVIVDGINTADIPQVGCDILWDGESKSSICHGMYLTLVDVNMVSPDMETQDTPEWTKVKQNNDGRSSCYSCGAPTEDREGLTSMYQVCTKCGL